MTFFFLNFFALRVWLEDAFLCARLLDLLHDAVKRRWLFHLYCHNLWFVDNDLGLCYGALVVTTWLFNLIPVHFVNDFWWLRWRFTLDWLWPQDLRLTAGHLCWGRWGFLFQLWHLNFLWSNQDCRRWWSRSYWYFSLRVLSRNFVILVGDGDAQSWSLRHHF